MKRVELTKFGFVRWPEHDFTDDGNRFQCYKAGKRVRVSKLVSKGKVYLSIDTEVGNGTLPFEVYGKLPHYNAANWKWNGVDLETLTEKDIEDFMACCLAYELEYENMERTFKFPTREEIEHRCKEVTELRAQEIIELNCLISSKLTALLINMTPYQWTTLQRYYNNLVAEMNSYNPDLIRKNESVQFCSDRCNALKPSWYYEHIKEMINN